MNTLTAGTEIHLAPNAKIVIGTGGEAIAYQRDNGMAPWRVTKKSILTAAQEAALLAKLAKQETERKMASPRGGFTA